MLPMDYQYFVSAWIYKVLRDADNDFADFLHNKGYGRDDTKLYKLFCFSRLNFGKPILWKEKKLFEIKQHELQLSISFDVNEAASTFIEGLFLKQEFYLGDKFNGIDFVVSSVSAMPEPEFMEEMSYQLQTPWVVSYQPEGRKHPIYLNPDNDMFNALAVKHLIEKYNNTHTPTLLQNTITLSPTLPYKRSGFLIKTGSQQETRVVGNLFRFKLLAPIEVHKMIWNAGISEKSASGFGWVELDEQML